MGEVIKTKKEFEIFFKDNFAVVYAFMKRYTNDEELAIDLAQETFVRVYERRSEIVSVEYTKAFLYTVARNLYWNHCKHKRTEEKYLAQLDEVGIDDYDFLEETTRQETIRVLRAAMDQLPPQTRRVIRLNLEGKNNNEVAEELGISVNTVKYLKKSAYTKLRGLMSKPYFMLLVCIAS